MAVYRTWEEAGVQIPFGRIGGEFKVFCPFCHSERRHHQHEKEMSVNLDKGVAHCHHCEKSIMIKKDQSPIVQFSRPKKNYKKPLRMGNPQMSEPLVKWFERRGISAHTLEQMKVTEGMEWMPQKGCEWITLQFNYFVNGEHTNTKFRTPDKCFKMVSGARLTPYNIDAIKNTDKCIICEGECFHPDMEVLTESGFVAFKDYNGGKVAQYNANGVVSFVNPLAIVRKDYDGDLVEFTGKSYYSLTTPNHNLVFCSPKDGAPIKKTAEELYSKKSANWSIPITAYGVDTKGLPISDWLLRFYVAVQADFTLRKGGDIYGAFKKHRKATRFSLICSMLGVPYTSRKDGNGNYSIFIRRNSAPQGCFKMFPMEWVSQLSYHQMKVVIDELVFWDGNFVPNRKQTEYSSKHYHNALFVQTIAHLCGYSSSIISRRNDFGAWYKVSVLFGKQHTRTRSLKRRTVPYSGRVYCVQVPSGMIVVRQNGKVSVSGNCDALTFIECGYPYAVSVPSGANTNLEYLDDFIESHFENKEVIYIATDTDEKGLVLREELVRRFGKDMCRIVTYNGHKDANELLAAEGREAVINAITHAAEIPNENILSLSDCYEQLDRLYAYGLQKGKVIGIPSIDNLISFETRRLAVVTGLPNHGKTEVETEIVARLNILHGWKVAFFSPESQPYELHMASIISKITGKVFINAPYGLRKKDYEEAKEYVNDNFYWVEPKNDYTLDSILSAAKWCVRRKGIRIFVIDPYNYIESDASDDKQETLRINNMLGKIKRFANEYDILFFLMAHPRKPQKDSEGNAIMPDLHEIAGSQHFANKADYGIVVHRNFKDNNTIFSVCKMKFRHMGSVGAAILYFDKNNGRFSDNMDWDENNWLKNRPIIPESAPMAEAVEERTEAAQEPEPISTPIPMPPVSETQRQAPTRDQIENDPFSNADYVPIDWNDPEMAEWAYNDKPI